MIYYKVVAPREDKLVSAMLLEENPFYRVYQENGKNKTVSNGMAFDDLETAKNFKSCHVIQGQIWECSGKPISLPKRIFDSKSRGYQKILDYVLYGKDFLDACKDSSFPSGSVRLKNLQLIRKVV